MSSVAVAEWIAFLPHMREVWGSIPRTKYSLWSVTMDVKKPECPPIYVATMPYASSAHAEIGSMMSNVTPVSHIYGCKAVIGDTPRVKA